MRFRLSILLAIVSNLGFGQIQQTAPLPGNGNMAQGPVSIRPDYVLGPNDQILIRVPNRTRSMKNPSELLRMASLTCR